MQEHFPEEYWQVNPARFHRDYWCGRKRAWEALVAEWEGGDVSVVSPPGAFLPLAGMKAINEYAIMRGQELQRDLIGCAELRTLATTSHVRGSALLGLARTLLTPCLLVG